MIEKILAKTNLSMEQKTAVRGRLRIIKEDFISQLKAGSFAVPLIFSLVLYHTDISKAIFWAVLTIVGYRIYRGK